MDYSARISDIIKSSLSGIGDLVDTSTIVGEPIKTDDGTTIIPIIKVSVGTTSGGFERSGKSDKPVSDKNAAGLGAGFTGGGGTGLTMSPVGFLVVKNTGAVDLLSLAAANSSSTTVDIIDRVADFVERSPEFVRKIKGIFSGMKKTDEDMSGEAKD